MDDTQAEYTGTWIVWIGKPAGSKIWLNRGLKRQWGIQFEPWLVYSCRINDRHPGRAHGYATHSSQGAEGATPPGNAQANGPGKA